MATYIVLMFLGGEVDIEVALAGQIALTHAAPHWPHLALIGVLRGFLASHDAPFLLFLSEGVGERKGPPCSDGRVSWFVKLYGNGVFM